MADPDAPANAVLEALGFALFVRKNGALCLAGNSPGWLLALWPGLEAAGAQLPVEKASPFLENFLVDAEAHWKRGGHESLRSGPWIEQTPDGEERTLEATALSAGGQSLLLLESMGRAFEEKKSMLQKARDTVIAYQRLESEMQKKEILLSTIAEGMNATLANIITSLRLLELESNTSRTRQLLSLATRATTEQQTLIHKILNLFAAELEALYGRNGDGLAEAKIESILRAVEAELATPFAEKQIRLTRTGQLAPDTAVAMDPAHLQRVFATALENALQRAPAGSEVQLEIVDEPESVLARVTDPGPLQAAELPETDLGTQPISEPELRLQFCRVAVENCHGETGCEEASTGGSCFWLRLPKMRASS